MPKGVYARFKTKYQFLINFEHVPGQCSVWPHARFDDGYGMVTVPGKNSPQKVHRVSWEYHNGPIPEGGWVLHHCDNPPCFNPFCLFLGDPQANVDDKVAKGRQARGSQIVKGPRHGEHNGNAKLTDQDVADIQVMVGTRPDREIAQIYGVSRSAVSKIRNGRSWASRSPSPALLGRPLGGSSQTGIQARKSPSRAGT